MNTARTEYGLMIGLQVLALGVLCYGTFTRLDEKDIIRAVTAADRRGDVSDNDKETYGLRREDAEAIRKGDRYEGTRVPVGHMEYAKTIEDRVTVKLGSVLEDLRSDLKRYETMSEVERERFEAKLRGRISDRFDLVKFEKAVRECLEDMSKCSEARE